MPHARRARSLQINSNVLTPPTLVSPEVPAPPKYHTHHQNDVKEYLSSPDKARALPEELTYRKATDNLDDCVECRYIAVQHGTEAAACTAQSCLPSTAVSTMRQPLRRLSML